MRDNGARSNFVTCCIPLSCKYRSDGGRNTPYGVPVVEASISSKSSGPLIHFVLCENFKI